MKTLAATVASFWVACCCIGQGTVNFANSPNALIYTNLISWGGTRGPTAPNLGEFMYGLFTASSTVTTIDANLQNLLTSTWTFTGVYATNTTISTGGRLSGGLNVTTITGWPAGVTNSFGILGWSTNLGTNWAQIEPQLFGLFNGVGPNITQFGWLGFSAIGFGMAGDPGLGFSLFGAVPNAQGTPLSTGFDLYPIIPEPCVLSLLALAVAGAMLKRFRSSRRMSG
jgi:hypothetical protein